MAFTSPSLFEPDLKRQWARNHLNLLKLEMDRYCERNRFLVSGEENAMSNEYVIKISHPNAVDALIAILHLSDFLNNLRACLDYLAWQLVIQNGQIPNTSTNFPISETDDSNDRRRRARATSGMSPAAVEVIEFFQPYRLGNDYKMSHLWRLGKLCNTQKHRHIAPFAVMPPWQFCLKSDSSKDDWLLRTEQIDNISILAFPIEAKDYIDFNPEGTNGELRFIDTANGIDVGYEDLVKMYDFITDEVVPSFAGIFPNPDVPWLSHESPPKTLRCSFGKALNHS